MKFLITILTFVFVVQAQASNYCPGLTGIELDDCRAGYLVPKRVEYTYKNCTEFQGVELDDCEAGLLTVVVPDKSKPNKCDSLQGVELDDCKAGL